MSNTVVEITEEITKITITAQNEQGDTIAVHTERVTGTNEFVVGQVHINGELKGTFTDQAALSRYALHVMYGA